MVPIYWASGTHFIIMFFLYMFCLVFYCHFYIFLCLIYMIQDFMINVSIYTHQQSHLIQLAEILKSTNWTDFIAIGFGIVSVHRLECTHNVSCPVNEHSLYPCAHSQWSTNSTTQTFIWRRCRTLDVHIAHSQIRGPSSRPERSSDTAAGQVGACCSSRYISSRRLAWRSRAERPAWQRCTAAGRPGSVSSVSAYWCLHRPPGAAGRTTHNRRLWVELNRAEHVSRVRDPCASVMSWFPLTSNTWLLFLQISLKF